MIDQTAESAVHMLTVSTVCVRPFTADHGGSGEGTKCKPWYTADKRSVLSLLPSPPHAMHTTCARLAAKWSGVAKQLTFLCGNVNLQCSVHMVSRLSEQKRPLMQRDAADNDITLSTSHQWPLLERVLAILVPIVTSAPSHRWRVTSCWCTSISCAVCGVRYWVKIMIVRLHKASLLNAELQ